MSSIGMMPSLEEPSISFQSISFQPIGSQPIYCKVEKARYVPIAKPETTHDTEKSRAEDLMPFCVYDTVECDNVEDHSKNDCNRRNTTSNHSKPTIDSLRQIIIENHRDIRQLTANVVDYEEDVQCLHSEINLLKKERDSFKRKWAETKTDLMFSEGKKLQKM
jgi:hypothetical protein